jgi:hypothetical protein
VSFGEVAGAAVVLIVVASSLLNRAKRGTKRPRAENPGLQAFEAMVEKRGGESGATDLRALLNAARAASETASHSATTTIEIQTSGAGPVDLGEILAAAREIKRSHDRGSDAQPVDARALLAAATALKAAARASPSEPHTPHKKKHHEPRSDQHNDSVAQFTGARPPLEALPVRPSLGAMRPMAAHAPMHPHSPIAAP